MNTMNKLLGILVCTLFSFSGLAQSVITDKWTYIQIDENRAKFGDYGTPDWLRYFGLDALDINFDGYKDLVSGRYIYLNPGGDMS